MHNIQSPRVDDAGIEAEIQAKGLTAPRITPADIEANIASEHYFTAADGVDGHDIAVLRAEDQSAPLTLQPMVDDPQIWRTSVIGPLHLLTFCVLVLRNGFTVTGESACASPENFDAEIGRKIARENAVNKCWPLLGYELKTKLAAVPPTFQERLRLEYNELGVKIDKLAAFLSTDTFGGLPKDQQGALTAQQAAMLDYYGCLGERVRAIDNSTT